MATAVEKHKGIIKPGKKFQARIFYPASASTQGHEGGPRGIGSFESFTEAVAALEAAQAKFDVGGEAAVWDGPKASRAKRNAVRCFTQTYGFGIICAFASEPVPPSHMHVMPVAR